MGILEVRDKVIVRTMMDQGDDPRYGDTALPYSVLRSQLPTPVICTAYGVRGICLSTSLRKNSQESTPYSGVTRLLHCHCQMILGIAHHPMLDTRLMQEARPKYSITIRLLCCHHVFHAPDRIPRFLGLLVSNRWVLRGI